MWELKVPGCKLVVRLTVRNLPHHLDCSLSLDLLLEKTRWIHWLWATWRPMYWFGEVRGACAVLAGCRCLTDALEVCFSACNFSFRSSSTQLAAAVPNRGIRSTGGGPTGNQQEMTLTSSTDLVG